jgi:uncharacterized membrane protein
MRKILVAGFFTSFLIGILFFFLKFLIKDALAPLFRPLILEITDHREYLVIPLTVVFTVIIIIIVGLAATHIHLQDGLSKSFRKSPKTQSPIRGALVALNNGTYCLAILIKEVDFKRADGTIEKYCVLYSPSAPFPWSGLPVIYARKETVLFTNLSFSEIYSIVGSFGENTPRSLVEVKN